MEQKREQFLLHQYQKTFYRPDEVARILGLSRRTIYRMIRDGRLPGIKFGKNPWRIPCESLTAIIKAPLWRIP